MVAAVAPPAHGQTGNGLYEPFPEPNAIERSKRFVEDLRTAGGSLSLSDEELEAGVLVDSKGRTRPAPDLDQGASTRAAGGSGLAAVIAWAAALGLFALAATAIRRFIPGPVPRRT